MATAAAPPRKSGPPPLSHLRYNESMEVAMRDKTTRMSDAERRRIERLIDEIVAQTFPASDPPAWGAVAALLEREDREAGETPESAGS